MELAQILRSIKECMTNGSLRQLVPIDAQLVIADVNAIPDEGPWPDYVEAHFEDGRGERYKLAVETYHGVGGFWAPS
jgi:hypothetical protein